MPTSARTWSSFEDGLKVSYEEEISGEAFFTTLAQHQSPDNRKVLLRFAEIERITISSIQHLIVKYGITTRDEGTLRQEGTSEATSLKNWEWEANVANMIATYPSFIEEFNALRKIAAKEDAPAIDILIEHEQAMLQFAIRTQAGHTDATEPLEQFTRKYGAPSSSL